MKKSICDILSAICVIAVFAGCIEGLDGSVSLWNIGCLAVAGVFGWLSKKTEDAK